VTEADDARRRRLRMRSWRRGIREMDLILGGFADAHLAGLDDATLAAYEAFLSENDHDLYRWVTGGERCPERFDPIVARIRRHIAGA
jgi:antitoxin CptB